jgi:hypothetical protein
MLNVYTRIDDCLQDVPSDAIDLSKVMTHELCEKLETIYNHHKTGSIYLGFVEPLCMLSPQEQIRIRKVFRKFEVYLIVANIFILPFSWKNGTRKLVVGNEYKNVTNPETFHVS